MRPSLYEADQLPYRSGGLMRCCILTLEEEGLPASELGEGDVLPCSYCSNQMVVHDECWERWSPRT